MKEYFYLLGSVPNPKHDDANPDPSFSFWAEPASTVQFYQDPDTDAGPETHQNDANLLMLVYRPYASPFWDSSLSFIVSVRGPPFLYS